MPPKSFLDLPPEIRLKVCRSLFRRSFCDRHRTDYGDRVARCKNATDEYIYINKERSLVKRKIIRPEGIIHITSGSRGSRNLGGKLFLDNCCAYGPASGNFNRHTATLRANKQLSAEASNVLYRDNGFDWVDYTGDGGNLPWHHPLLSRASFFPAHLVKRMELKLPTMAQWLDEDEYDDVPSSLETLLREILRGQLVNVVNLRLYSAFSLGWAKEDTEDVTKRFLGAVGRICAEHQFLKKTMVSLQRILCNWRLDADYYNACMTVELCAINEAKQDMVLPSLSWHLRERALTSTYRPWISATMTEQSEMKVSKCTQGPLLNCSTR